MLTFRDRDRSPRGTVSKPTKSRHFEWDANYLLYAVREPWPSKTSQSTMVFDVIKPDKPLILNSYMAEHGVKFSDGIESDFVKFNSGHTVTIGIAEHKVKLIE